MAVATAIALATTNPGKIAEFRALMPGGIAVYSLADFSLPPPEETGATFAENARIKAVALSSAIDLIVVADDSGLEIEALDGAPGVRSARFAGEPGNDQRNTELVLSKLAASAHAPRTARFVCAVSIAWRGKECFRASGTCDGTIGTVPRGNNGFGYDPIFVLPDGRTMAELAPEEKNQISHRARAFRAVADPLRALIDEQRSAGEIVP